MVKAIQGIWMTFDLDMYHEIADHLGQVTQFPMTVNTSDLNEELGMVEQIFSDKVSDREMMWHTWILSLNNDDV